jgi:uncharacterized coiled-coil DUF342 family protein
MDTAAQPETIDSTGDTLSSLEARILRTVELVEKLRSERDAALAELNAVRNTAATSLADTQKLRQEVENLRAERKHVRARIEKLLGQVESLSAS